MLPHAPQCTGCPSVIEDEVRVSGEGDGRSRRREGSRRARESGPEDPGPGDACRAWISDFSRPLSAVMRSLHGQVQLCARCSLTPTRAL